MVLKFEKKQKRDVAITVRLKSTTVKKLKELAKRHAVSQADVIEKLIEDL